MENSIIIHINISDIDKFYSYNGFIHTYNYSIKDYNDVDPSELGYFILNNVKMRVFADIEVQTVTRYKVRSHG